MSTNSWNGLFARALRSKQNLQTIQTEAPRLALIGVGSELYGDDAAGVIAARRLRTALGEHPEVLVIDAGPSPENFTGLLRHFQPNLVILIDAADMGDPPGTVHWIEWDDVDGMSASTHRLPPGTLVSFLMTELGCRVALLGIQVGDVGIDQPMTPAVNAAVEQLVIEWTNLVSRH